MSRRVRPGTSPLALLALVLCALLAIVAVASMPDEASSQAPVVTVVGSEALESALTTVGPVGPGGPGDPGDPGQPVCVEDRPNPFPDFDSGHVAVIHADPTILQPGEAFDLNGRTLTFTPRADGGYTTTTGPLESASDDVGEHLGMTHEDSRERFLPFSFRFFGQLYPAGSSIFIDSNGFLTFQGSSIATHFNDVGGGGATTIGDDLSTVLDAFAGDDTEQLPRIAVLWQDWDPDFPDVRGVFYKALGDRVVVTWLGVIPFGAPIFPAFTFQVVLFSDGTIKMNYGEVGSTPGGGYLVGISPGNSVGLGVTAVDLSHGCGSLSTFPTVEPLGQVFGQSDEPLVHLSALARRFYRTHRDRFDQLLMIANFDHAMGGALAFEVDVRQSVRGIHSPEGDTPFADYTSFTGSAGRLQSSVNLNTLSLYPPSPDQIMPGTPVAEGLTPLALLGQESGHLWLASVKFSDGGVCSEELLGRDLGHWSFFHDTDGSVMEGNDWQDNGGGSFTSIGANPRYSALDQYIMGLRPASEVPPFFFIGATNPAGRTRGSPPETGVTVSGTRRTATVGDVITCEGARVPASGFSGVNSTSTWNQGFVLLVKDGTTPPAAEVSKLEALRTAWTTFFGQATGGRGSVQTTLVDTFTVTVTKVGSGTVTGGGIDCGSQCSASFTAGTSLTLTATAAPGFLFTQWIGMPCVGPALPSASCQTFVTASMPVTTVFTASPILTVGIAGAGSGTVSSSAGGISCRGDCQETYESGRVILMTASPAAGSLFAAWSAECVPAPDIGPNACRVTMTSSKTVTATFERVTFVLTVSVTGGGGGTVTSDPSGVSCGATCSAPFETGTPVTLTATPAPGAAFRVWGGACGGAGPCSVTMDQAKSVTATFAFPLTVARAGTGTGGITSEPTGVTCAATCGGAFDAGTSVTLIAAAASGSTFDGWSGCLTVSGDRCTVTVDAAKTVTATFTALTATLSVTKAGGTAGTVSSDVPGIACGVACAATFNVGATVRLTATPMPPATFGGWSGACEGPGACVITIDGAKSVVARFVHTLSVTKSGSGGSVTSAPVGVDCGAACSATFTAGAVVTLTATPVTGAVFGGWSAPCASPLALQCVVTLDTARAVTATFVPRPDLTVTALTLGAPSVAPGGRLRATVTVRNQGLQTALVSTARFYLSTNAARDGLDKRLSPAQVFSAVGSGQSQTKSVTLSLPRTTAPGEYFVVVCADDLARVTESDDANNCRESETRVTVTGPDLTVDAVAPLTPSVRAGARLTVTVTVRNAGGLSAGTSVLRVYLSSDEIRGADQLLTGTRTFASLKAGATSTVAFAVTIPRTMPAGDYFVLACADDLGRLTENDEGNNCRASGTPIQVMR